MNLKRWCLFMAVSLTFIYFGLAGSRPFGKYLDRMYHRRITGPPPGLPEPPPLKKIPNLNESVTFTFGKHFSNLDRPAIPKDIPTPPTLIPISNLKLSGPPPQLSGPPPLKRITNQNLPTLPEGLPIPPPLIRISNQYEPVPSTSEGAGPSRPEPPFQCQICQKEFTQKSQLNRHLKTHEGEKDLQCPVCKKYFSRMEQLWNHMKLHPNQDWGYASLRRTSKAAEPEIRTGPLAAAAELMNAVVSTGLPCPYCDIKSLTMTDLKWHGKQTHNKTIGWNDFWSSDPHNETMAVPYGHQCFYCLSFVAYDFRTFIKHFKKMHLLNGSCPVCPIATKHGLDGKELPKHIRGHQEFYAWPGRPVVGSPSDRDSSIEFDRHYISSESSLRSPDQGLSDGINEQLLRLTNPTHDEPRAVPDRTHKHKDQFLAETFTKDFVTGAEKKSGPRAVKRGGGERLNAVGRQFLNLKKFRQDNIPLPRLLKQRG